MVREQARGSLDRIEHILGHPVVNDRSDGRVLGLAQRLRRHDEIGDAALDASDGAQAADVGDVGRFRRPGRHCAEARHDQQQLARGCTGLANCPGRRAVTQQCLDDRVLLLRQRSRHLDQMDIPCVDRFDVRNPFADGRQDLFEPEIR